MASLNRNIKTGNFIPGSEEYTRPEEIAIMGKYLRSGIKNLSDSLELETKYDKGISNKAQIKNLDSLPGEETLTGISNKSSNVDHLDQVKEVLKYSNKHLELDTEFEKITKNRDNQELSGDVEKLKKSSEKLKLDENEELLRTSQEKLKLDTNILPLDKQNKDILLEDNKDEIYYDNSGNNINPVDVGSYEKYFLSDPKRDKRSLPDSENTSPRFRELDTLLGGVHYDKYSSETLSRSTTPSKDAVEAASEGSSDIIFVKPENLQTTTPNLVSDFIDGLPNEGDNIKELSSDFEKLSNSNIETELNNKKEFLKKKEDNTELSNKVENLKNPGEISLNTTQESLDIVNEDLSLSTIIDNLKKNSQELKLTESKEDLEKDNLKLELSDFTENINEDERKLALSKYVDSLLDGKITKLEDQKEFLPNELKKAVLIDHLKHTIKNDEELELVLNSEKLLKDAEKVALSNFINKLNKNLKQIVQLNEKYITLGKDEGSFNFITDLYTDLTQIANSEFSSPYISKELNDIILSLELEKIIDPQGTSVEYYTQIKNNYGIGLMSAEELKKTLDELVNSNGSWGKKVAAYLSALIGKYKNFKTYLPKEAVREYKDLVNKEFKDYDLEFLLKDEHSVTKENIIEETLGLLQKLMKDKVKRVEKIISSNKLSEVIKNKDVYKLSVGNQKYSKNATLLSTWKSIKTELIDNTWDTIKGWVTSTLNNSLFGAAGSLLTTKVNLPGHDYSFDTTIRNVPNVVGFYDKKTKTTSFSGTPFATPMETTAVDKNSSEWLSRSLSKNREYSFRNNYLLSTGIQQTLKDLCDTDISSIYSVEDLYDTLKKSEKTTAHARTADGVMNGMTLSSNHVWEITIEPYISKFNGYRTWLPFFQEINRYNYRTHGVRTIYDKWLPITSFELQDKRLVNKTLALYAGEISYPIVMEHSNELRITICDDSFKSFKTYFDHVAEISTFESVINKEGDATAARLDANFAKRRKYDSFVFSKDISENVSVGSTYETVDKDKFAVGMYKNLCFNICIYILTPQYSTIKKYNLLCVMKDYSIEYMGEIDSGPADVTVSFSIVGETSPMLERDLDKEMKMLLSQLDIQLQSELSKMADTAIENMHNSILNMQGPLSRIDVYTKKGVLEDNTQEENRTIVGYTKNGEWTEEYGYGTDPDDSFSTYTTKYY